MEVKVSMSNSDFRFDKRVAEWHMAMGYLKKEEYENYLKQLKDVAENATFCDTSPLSLSKQLPQRSLEEEDEEL